MNGNDWLNVENILSALVRAGVEIGVVLEWEIVEVADRVLQLLGERGCVVLATGFGRRSWRRRLRGDPSNGSALITETLQINFPPLVINTATLQDATRGVLYSAPLTATGGSGGYSWSLASGALPNGLSVNPGGSIGGTPLVGDVAGNYTFDVSVMDSSSMSTTKTLTLTLRNPALALSPASLPTGIVNGTYNTGVTASGGTGGPYTYSWSGTTPGGLSLNPATGAITGMPSASGTFNFTIGVSDGSPFTPAFAPQNYSISVLPAITIAPSSIPAGDATFPYSQTFTASGGSGAGFTYSLSPLPPGMNFNTATGVLAGPAPASRNL